MQFLLSSFRAAGGSAFAFAFIPNPYTLTPFTAPYPQTSSQSPLTPSPAHPSPQSPGPPRPSPSTRPTALQLRYFPPKHPVPADTLPTLQSPHRTVCNPPHTPP